jgi:hypothetical protein
MGMKTTTLQEKYAAAAAKLENAYELNMSRSTINKRAREFFAAEDALKAGEWLR